MLSNFARDFTVTSGLFRSCVRSQPAGKRRGDRRRLSELEPESACTVRVPVYAYIADRFRLRFRKSAPISPPLAGRLGLYNIDNLLLSFIVL